MLITTFVFAYIKNQFVNFFKIEIITLIFRRFLGLFYNGWIYPTSYAKKWHPMPPYLSLKHISTPYTLDHIPPHT
jgi:hypothetical protein